jgi:hypothetical protein
MGKTCSRHGNDYIHGTSQTSCRADSVAQVCFGEYQIVDI